MKQPSDMPKPRFEHGWIYTHTVHTHHVHVDNLLVWPKTQYSLRISQIADNFKYALVCRLMRDDYS